MTNSLERKPNSAISQWRAHKGDDPAWLWWLVAGSSIAAHVLLLNLTLPFSSRLSSAASSNGSPIAIDLVQLPPDKPSAPAPAKPATAAPIAIPNANSAPAASSAAPAAPPIPASTAPATAGDIAFAPSIPPVSPAPVLAVPAPIPAAPAQSLPVQTPAPLSQLEPAPPPSFPPTIAPQLPEGTIENAFPESAPLSDPAPPAPPAIPPVAGEPASNSASAPATPTAPQIVTVPIGVPVPDVSETLPIPPSPVADSLGQVETPQQAIPVRLTASLTATPAPDATELPDAIARPSEESETLDPRSSSCQITPDVLPYLGQTVAVQVTTNEAGQATDTRIRQSSNSPVYDDLALCMVRQWQFEPAMREGSPVVSDALVVAVRVE